MTLKKRILLVFCLLISVLVSAQQPAFKITNKVSAEIDSKLFGQFMEKPSWGGEIGGDGVIDKKTGKVFPDAMKYFKAMNIPLIRYPGGTDIDYYQWYNLIDNVPGKHSKRPAYRNYSGNNNVTSDNRLGLDEFLALCEELKTEPLLAVNLGDAFFKKTSIAEAAKNAADFVAYCNVSSPKKLPAGMTDWVAVRKKNGRNTPYKVKYFEVGNEIQYFKSMKEKGVSDSIVSHYMDCLEAIVNAMLAVDPTIKIIADGEVKEVSEKIKPRLGNKISYLACHFYSPWQIDFVKKDTSKVDLKTLSASDIWYAWVAPLAINPSNGLTYFTNTGKYEHASLGGYDLAVTEWNWNGWWNEKIKKDAALSSNFVKGVGVAGFLHAMMRDAKHIKIGCQSMLVGNSWGINAIRLDTNGIKPVEFYPSGKVTGLYAKYHGNQLLDVEITQAQYYEQKFNMTIIQPAPKVAMVDVVASRSKNKVYVAFINRSFNQDLTVTLNLSDFRLKTKYQQHIYSSTDVKSADKDYLVDNSAQFTNTKDVQVVLPQHSVSIAEFQLQN